MSKIDLKNFNLRLKQIIKSIWDYIKRTLMRDKFTDPILY